MSEQDVRDGLVADLDALEPGPELVAVLDDLSPDSLTGDELAAYVRACARLANHGTARLLDAMHHLGRGQAGRTDRRQVLDEYSGDEVAVALGWSRSMACRKLDLADDLAARLPAVGEALWDGWLDEPKATRLCEWTRDLCDDHARHVAQVLLPEAPELPVGELIRRIEQTATAIDPDWAARREARAAKNLRVTLTANPSGTATFAVCDTTAPRGLAMRDRCDAIAAAVRALGVRLPVGDLRGEVAARLLDGSTAGLTDHQIICILATEYHAAGQPPDGPDDTPDDGSDGGGPDGLRDDGPNDDGPNDDGPNDDGPNDDGPGGRGPNHGPNGTPDDGLGDGPSDGGVSSKDAPPEESDHETGCAEPTEGGEDGEDGEVEPVEGDHAEESAAEESAADESAADESAAEAGETAGQGMLDLPGPPDPERPTEPPVPEFPPEIDGPDPGPGRVRIGTGELRLRLTTALGLDHLPATVPGYGTVLAHHARTLLAAAHHGEWRIVLTTPDGHLQHVLLARRRPADPRGKHQPRGPGQRRAIVELQVPTTLLAALDPADHPSWAPLLCELQARLPELEAPGPPREHLAEHRRRRPSAEIDRWIRVRDRCCVVPGCHRPAHTAELDHTHDWALLGPTAHWNLGVFDKHHHRAKHLAGWIVAQPAPGHFRIRTRAGQRLNATPKKILEPLPEPRPAHKPRPLPDDGWRAPAPDDAQQAADDAAWRHHFLTRTGGAAGRKGTRRARPTSPATATATAVVHDPDDPPPF